MCSRPEVELSSAFTQTTPLPTDWPRGHSFRCSLIDAPCGALPLDDADRAAGTSALVWKDGQEIRFGSAGYADREAQRPMTRDASAQIYSMTKPITGVALMQLWEQGKFRLDDPLWNYLTEFASMKSLRVRTPQDFLFVERRRDLSSYPISCGTRQVSPTDRATRRRTILAPNWGRTGAWMRLVSRLANRSILKTNATGKKV